MEDSTRLKMESTDPGSKPQEVLLNDLYIDPIGFRVKRGKTDIDLTVKEFELLYFFVQNKGKVVKREDVLKIIATPNMLDEDGAINVMICRLRKKLEDNLTGRDAWFQLEVWVTD